MAYIETPRMESRRRFYTGCIKAVASGSLNLVARQKAKDGGDPLETGMNEGGSGNHGFRGAFLVTFGAFQK